MRHDRLVNKKTGNKMKKQEIKQYYENLLRETIQSYEDYCKSGQAQSFEAQADLIKIKTIMKKLDIEFMSHNAAFYGWKRYKKYINKNLNRAIKVWEYAMLSEEQKENFENLTTFPFKI